MNKIIYNISLAVALGLVTAGTGLVWGLGVALIVCGLLVVALTALTVTVGG